MPTKLCPALWPLCLSLLVIPSLAVASPADDGVPDLQTFWEADSEKEARKAARALEAAGVEVDAVLAGLRAGRPFSSDVRTGAIDRTRRGSNGEPHPYKLLVPQDYDPARSYEVRVYLHGGVGRGAWRSGGRWWSNTERLAHRDQIAVFPASWSSSQWWEATQVDNLDAILHELKRTYNIDENRVHLFGVSDGGTGAWFQAFRNPTPWASFLPFIGHPAVLSNRRMGTDGDMFVRNLVNRPFFVVTGDHDRLYPTSSVVPFLLLFEQAGTKLYHRPQAEGGHDLEFWPEEAPYIDAFVQAHARDPLPDRLKWETERTDRYRRIHWLLVEELGRLSGERELEDWNTLFADRPERAEEAFPRRGQAGRLEAVREGNLFRIRSQGVRAFTLLLAPGEIDVSRPVELELNGQNVFSGKIRPSLETLLQWAYRDQDRSMLFVAELRVTAGADGVTVAQSSR